MVLREQNHTTDMFDVLNIVYGSVLDHKRYFWELAVCIILCSSNVVFRDANILYRGCGIMNFFDFVNRRYPINISTHIKVSRRIKSLSKEQKQQINKGMNINV